MSLKIIKRLAEIAKEEFKDIVTDTEILHAVRLRLELVDGSTVDILYPMREKYSFHWRQEDKVFRINTAPHHPQIASFPRHMIMKMKKESSKTQSHLPRLLLKRIYVAS